MGKVLVDYIMLFVATNGWWYYLTVDEPFGKTPLVLIPIVSSIYLLVRLVGFILDNWDD